MDFAEIEKLNAETRKLFLESQSSIAIAGLLGGIITVAGALSGTLWDTEKASRKPALSPGRLRALARP